MNGRWIWGLPGIALVLLTLGVFWGLFVAPPEREMGDVYRIIFVHVPSAWMALVAFTVTFVASIAYLMRASWTSDALAVASAEVGVLFNALLLITGSLWGKPTWGVWWTFDPRLTTAAIMFFAYSGYLALRSMVDGPERRATWSALMAVLIYVDIPVVWFSVKWWNTLHQLQSSPETVDAAMVFPLRLNAFAFLFLYLSFVAFRFRLERGRQKLELQEPPPVAETTRVLP